MKPKEQAQLDTQDWNEVEVLRASLREHMAEIHRLRAAGQNAINTLFAIRDGATGLWGDDLHRCNNALDHLIADFAEQPVTDCKEGDKLAPPLDVPETNFGNMAQAVDSTEADQSEDALEMVEPEATSQESRQVEPVAWLHEWEGVTTLNMTPPKFYGDHWKHTPLYPSAPAPTWTQAHWTEYERGIVATEREPLTDKEISDLFDGQIFHLTDVHSVIDFVRDIERAHGIGGEE